MGRRSDHSREELHRLILETGVRLVEEKGLSGFSVREVAKRIGYSVGTLYYLFGSYDRLMLAINGETLDRLAQAIEASLAHASHDRLHAIARTYFDFAEINTNAWRALFEFRLPAGTPVPADHAERLARMFGYVESELAARTGRATKSTHRAARLLFSAVHGICQLGLDGTMRLLGETDARRMAIELIDNYLAGSVQRRTGRKAAARR